jgi:hypothetical protein
MTAIPEPNAQVLKYKLRNQSRCAEPELMTNNQKHNSVGAQIQFQVRCKAMNRNLLNGSPLEMLAGVANI